MPRATMTAQIVGMIFYRGAADHVVRLRPGAVLRVAKPERPPYVGAVGVFAGDKQLGLLTPSVSELLTPKLEAGVEITVTKAPVNAAVVSIEWEQDDTEIPPLQIENVVEFAKRFKNGPSL